MKRLLLLVAVLLMALGASAQLRNDVATVKPQIKCEEMQMRAPGTPVLHSSRAAGDSRLWYRRPAGGFPAFDCKSDDGYFYWLRRPLLYLKPFSTYTFNAFPENLGAANDYHWTYTVGGQTLNHYAKMLPVSYGLEVTELPYLSVLSDHYQLGLYPVPPDSLFSPGNVATTLHDEFFEDITDLLVSNKTMCPYGRFGNANQYALSYYSGAAPYGNNDNGWWFGKNGDPRLAGGIANAFEKPEHPYLLKQVALECAYIEVSAPLELTCKVYRLPDGLPAYQDEESVTLDHVPGELIATGRATVTPATTDLGIILFDLYGQEDGLEYKVCPTIDDAILVAFEGFNDPSAENLTDFSASVGTDYNVDEGFGEMAYILINVRDEDGNYNGEVKWTGLNNFFSMGQMMTGYTLFIIIDQPYLTFLNSGNTAVYTFPAEGGLMKKNVGNIVESSIRFRSSNLSEDDGWFLSTPTGEDVPDWLSIELIDHYYNGEFDYVNARVVADALPAGMLYREATVRFAIPGDYLDYTFKQGEKSTIRGDVNGDGLVTISDVTSLINYLLTDDPNGVHLDNANTNLDDQINITDLTVLINFLLTDTWPSTNKTFTVNGVTFTMVHVSAGTFTMGATPEQTTSTTVEDYPPHEVTLSSYYIGQTEVTQELWQAVMGTNPSNNTASLQLPVEKVNYSDCQTFISRLNELTGENFRLPTEAEWEFAARGGNKSKGYKFAGSNTATQVGWISSNATGTHEVGGLEPNELELYDMCGNVFEWVQDWYAAYTPEAQVNPTGPTTGDNRVFRGGSYFHNVIYCRNAYRGRNAATVRLSFLGMRLAL